MVKRTNGFTLVELLAVVAIIALLISILLPSLGKAKEHARMVTCLANLKSLGVAYGSYTNQNDQWYPQASGNGGFEPTWDFVLRGYYDDRRLLHCPSDPPQGHPICFQSRNERWDEPLWWPDGVSWDVNLSYQEKIASLVKMPEKDRFPRSYSMNVHICSQGPSWYGPNFWPGYVHKTPRVTRPAETILLGECWYWAWGVARHYVPNIHNDYTGSHIRFNNDGNSRRPTLDVHRNNDAANHLFCDFSAATLPEDDPKFFNFGGHQYYYFKVNK